MSCFDDDDEFHTPEERQADDDDRQEVDELCRLDEQLDAQQRGLERLAHEDLVGLVWFGQSDEFGDPDAWIDKRLGRGTPQ